MRRCHYSIVIFTYLSCFGFNINPVIAASYDKAPSFLKVAQADSSNTNSRTNLKIGSVGEDVKLLQTQLKKLGYYDGSADGQFGESTRDAVIEFQLKKKVLADGVVGNQTNELIKAETLKQNNFVSTPTPEPVPEDVSETEKPSKSDNGLIKLVLIVMGLLAGGGILFYLFKLFKRSKQPSNRPTYDDNDDDETYIAQAPEYEASQDGFVNKNQDQKYLTGTQEDNLEDVPSTIQPSAQIIPTEKTSSLAKLNVVDELIEDLDSSNPTQRRKAIWELGQKGDSRAIQPLVEQMVDADSQQRSLILAALSEIGTRTLKPMNRALAVSMQDESPDVRKNAIRDLTRVYDVMGQISQMLSMAMEDEDPEVQETAKYAVSQMNRIRVLPSEQPQPQPQLPEEWEDSEQ
ncbi:peptidoglycan binding domain-containing protein [Calothrix parasitica NIES-267]|uniref:Peptidoglycan binding domain-containing protein n=1 Tax=Calothrix parasitica NIES-267 TaxID=1973488 RepID=A0A1Z4LIL9_9CYAN|nr:peptidoglycan binding domain-containing protein [Calothrix parasitica NIES-267]